MRIERAEQNGEFAGGLLILAKPEEVAALKVALNLALGSRKLALKSGSPTYEVIAKFRAVLKMFEGLR